MALRKNHAIVGPRTACPNKGESETGNLVRKCSNSICVQRTGHVCRNSSKRRVMIRGITWGNRTMVEEK